MSRRPWQSVAALALGILCGAAILVPGPGAAGMSVKEALQFAADMAERGSWREARYRWQQVAEREPASAIVENNLAVAAEAVGDFAVAETHYAAAVELSGADPHVVDNERRAERLRRELRERGAASAAADPAPEEAPAAPPAPSPGGARASGKLGKAVEVRIEIPVPPPLDVSGRRNVLVASFLTEASAFLDVNRELVRLLRGQFRKQTALEVLDVVPPPAIPEQRPDDLVRNAEFWKHLAHEHGADLVVSGDVTFTRRDVSGFREVDYIDARTGQKVRQVQFQEQEEFAYDVEVFFFDGASGGLLHRDRVRRNVLFRGLMNDPLHAFYEIGDSIGDDVLSAVVTRTRSEARTIFRR